VLISHPSMLNAPRLRAALTYWDAKRQNKLMPPRSDIDPVEIPRLLPYVMLIDVVREPLDFRYRLMGTQACDIMRGGTSPGSSSSRSRAKKKARSGRNAML
jgi:PAS domain-containing protein